MKKIMILAVAVFVIFSMTRSSFAQAYWDPSASAPSQVSGGYVNTSTWTPSGN
jgi:hypothetical protein